MTKPAWAIGGRTGPVRSFQGLSVFACEGLICVIDERPGKKEGEATIVMPNDMQKRVNAVMRKNTRMKQATCEMKPWQRQEQEKRVNGANAVVVCIREARDMGDPSDPAVQAWWSRHRRSSTIRLGVHAGSDKEGYPELPVVPLGKKTGKTAAIDHEAVVPPNVHAGDFPVIHKRPVKKSRGGVIVDL